MTIHFVFNVLYLVALSWCADGYHKRLKIISNLKTTLTHPKAKKESIYKAIDESQMKLRKFKFQCFKILLVLFFIHCIFTWIFATDYGKYDWEEFLYPIGGIIASCLILLVIFWLKGKGGGVPSNKFMESRQSPGFFR